MLDVGQTAPDFKLPSTVEGDALELSAELAKHRATIVAFYVFDFTPG